MARRYLGSVALLATLLSTTASAAVYDVTLQGTLTQQTSTGSQTPFKVGDVLTLTTRFTGADPAGTQTFRLYGLPTTGAEFWRIDGGGFTWRSSDDTLDGLAGPTLTFSGSTLTGVSGDLLRTNSPVVPYLVTSGSAFSILPGNFLYGNTSDPGRFSGVWNFASASVLVSGLAVPEPANWGLMIVGFAGVGAAFRIRRRLALASV